MELLKVSTAFPEYNKLLKTPTTISKTFLKSPRNYYLISNNKKANKLISNLIQNIQTKNLD